MLTAREAGPVPAAADVRQANHAQAPAEVAVDVGQVDAGAHAAAAAALLRCAWTPPCVRYSDDYVRWHLSHPGAAPAVAVMARDGNRPVGFVALLPRGLARDAGTTSVYVLSFFAVHPEYRGARIGFALAARAVALADRPVIVYTQPGSRSARVLARAAEARGWIYRPLAGLRTYAGGSGPGHAGVAVRHATVEEYVAAVKGPLAPGDAWRLPTLEEAAYSLTDPRGACLAVAEREGATRGAALIVRSQLVTAAGNEDVPALDSVHIDADHAAVLSAFRVFALAWSGGAPVVTAANLHAVPAGAIREAGFRATRSSFDAALIGEPSDPFVSETRSTNLEVV